MNSLMKKLIFTLLSCMLILPPVFGEESEPGKNKVSVGAGYLSFPQIFYLEKNIWDSFFDSMLDDVESREDNSSGPFFIQYDRMLGNHLSLGGTYVYDKIDETTLYKNGDKDIIQYDCHSAMANCKLYWGTKRFKIYHGLSYGVLMLDSYEYSKEDNIIDESDDFYFSQAFNLTALGIELTLSNNIYTYVDCGIGFMGMLNIGAGYRF